MPKLAGDQLLGNDHNKPQSLMSDPISTMYFHNTSCGLSNRILFKPIIKTFLIIFNFKMILVETVMLFVSMSSSDIEGIQLTWDSE